ncbi:alanyl-tRNA editing protein [Ornithinibacillus halotolerans]|uniref:Alanine--tRNA ligase n=1 Tax=Ornithinibacillus halotolerans TaxID=1274357 RepID=A0A916S520_9BACI|nr:DHHA1 domain-containing protein [Ornithinibacillus halotolerans]GGA81403.1 alanyl-tRNA editing protein [Ornithinibacillus halotolerans]
MSEKLYYQDQYLGRFSSRVEKIEQDDDGKYFAILEQTAFYPTGGGQPHDIGTLNEVKVYDVEEIDGEIRHYIEEPINKEELCVGEINWDRRMDHMQQHAGQHILSAAFAEEYKYETISFHLGTELCSIDLHTDSLTEDEVIQTERMANLIILENRPIETKWVTKQEINKYKLRKELAVTENIRLVIIPEFDYNGCGGTHPRSTGEVGSIQVLHWEKHKKHIRVYFVCGRRVRQQLRTKHQVIQRLTKLLSAPQEKLEVVTEQMLAQMSEYEKQIATLQMEIVDYEATTYIEKAEIIEGQSVIKISSENKPMAVLQQLAKKIANLSSESFICIVNETSDKLQLVCAKGENLPINMNQLIKIVLPKINGKGGGNENIAQGGGEKTQSKEELFDLIVSTFFDMKN